MKTIKKYMVEMLYIGNQLQHIVCTVCSRINRFWNRIIEHYICHRCSSQTHHIWSLCSKESCIEIIGCFKAFTCLFGGVLIVGWVLWFFQACGGQNHSTSLRYVRKEQSEPSTP